MKAPQLEAPTSVRSAACLVLVAVLSLVAGALVAGACGSSPHRVAQLRPGATATRDSTAQTAPPPGNGALAFAHCMRAHGVPDFPDPGTGGEFPKATLGQLAATNSRYRAAQTTCQHLLPAGRSRPTSAEARRVEQEALKFSRCVRRHGVPDFPDPGSDGRIPDPASVGVDQGSPQFEAANQACRAYRPPYMPSNSAYNAWARTSTS